jgi:hypothetical protein
LEPHGKLPALHERKTCTSLFKTGEKREGREGREGSEEGKGRRKAIRKHYERNQTKKHTQVKRGKGRPKRKEKRKRPNKW